MRVVVAPRLAALTIGEVVSCATNSQVQDDVVFAVEGSSIWLVDPWVVIGLRELTALPEALILEANLENLVGLVIDVGVEAVLVPVETVGVELISKGRAISGLPDLVGKREAVLIPSGAPVKSRAEGIIATLATIRRTISTRFHDIDLTR